jgi:hypothetical protein
VRRGQATRLLTLTDESSLAARNLAQAAEPGALAGIPEAVETLDRLIANTEVLLAATVHPSKPARLVSGSQLAPRVNVSAGAATNGAGELDRIHILHLRRVINCLDRLDKQLLGMAAPLAQTVAVPADRAPGVADQPPSPNLPAGHATTAPDTAAEHKADENTDAQDRLEHPPTPGRSFDDAAPGNP